MENKEKKNKPKLTFIYYGLIIFGVIIIACLSVKNPDGEKTTPIKDSLINDSIKNTHKDTAMTSSTPSQPSDEWIISEDWQYGKWKGDIKDGKPHGNDTVIYLEEIEYPTTNFSEQKIEKGFKIIGVYTDGNLIEGDIYDQNGKFIKKINTPTL